MDFQKPFFYQFEDARWPEKLGVGALISLIPILNLATAGYSVQVIRNVVAGHPEPLPAWDDLGQKFLDGLILFAAGLIYALPIMIFLCFPVSLLVASGLVSANSSMKQLTTSLAAVGGVALVCFFGVFVLYALFLSIIRPIILVVFSYDRTFASCFRIGEFLRILSRYPGPFFATWGVMILAGLALTIIVGFINLVFGWIPLIGWLVSIVLTVGSAIYLITADGHLFGQFRKIALENEPPVHEVVAVP